MLERPASGIRATAYVMTIDQPLPPIQDHAAAWYGPSMARRAHEWTYCLTGHEIAELESAAGRWTHPPRELTDTRAGGFKLPTLGAKLLALRRELIHGRGFALLRGLPVERYSGMKRKSFFAAWAATWAWPDRRTRRASCWATCATSA